MNFSTVKIGQAIVRKSLPLLPAPQVPLLGASKTADGRQAQGSGRRSKVDHVGQALGGQRRSPADNVCLTRSGLRLRWLSACVLQATLPVRDTPPLPKGGKRAI